MKEDSIHSFIRSIQAILFLHTSILSISTIAINLLTFNFYMLDQCFFLPNPAVVGINTSEDFVNTSGELAVINIDSRKIVRRIPLGGQPDSVIVSPDKKYIAIAIENERDEDLEEVDGRPPQLPAGFLVIVDTDPKGSYPFQTDSSPTFWTTRKVELTNLPNILYPEDPEPEYVAINEDNIAVVTLQENNGLVLVDLEKGEVLKSFNAGSASLDQIDTIEDAIINQVDSDTILREPDGVTWIGTEYFATAVSNNLCNICIIILVLFCHYCLQIPSITFLT